MKTESQKPNYRIYDRTGGGVTHDIYADSLEDAIEQGREWIEEGDWGNGGGEDSGEGRVYQIGIQLDCGVREIVYVSINEQGVYERVLHGYDDERYTVRAEDGQLVDEDDNELGLAVGDIDEDATICGDEHDCSGEYSETLPDCQMRDNAGEDDEPDDEGHVWRQPYSVVGGLKENPGEWGGTGTNSSSLYVCRLCGCYRHEHRPGFQRNPGEARETITISPRDEKSEAWLKEQHEEDGWLPDWLAEYLGCAPTVRMTEEEAKEWVAEHDDSGDLDEDELEHAFAAIMGRRADDDDRAEGLWSHLCATVK